MSSFLEQYGKAIFVLVLVAILIAFAGPLGMKIKNATTDKVSQTEQIGCDEFTVATGGTVRPTEPAEAVDNVYCIYYKDGEMTISQNEIEPEEGRTVVKKGFYNKPKDCTYYMTTVSFVGAVKPKSCANWFGQYDNGCTNLKEVKNIENLYTSNVTDMNSMFNKCYDLTNLDVSKFDTSHVTNMSRMFYKCQSLTSLDVSNFDTSKVTDMNRMFKDCSKLISLDLSKWNIVNVTSRDDMFDRCSNLKSITVPETAHEKFFNYTGIPSDVTLITK